jgi:aminoglycoside phosphotransferase (APT) family kinase protein
MNAAGFPFDLANLQAWLQAERLCQPPLRLTPIGDGHSNLTYAVHDAQRTVVLRRPPPPPVPRGGNDVLREARILRALAGTGVPVPAVLAVAAAGAVMDVPCYVMEHLDGVVATGVLPPAIDTPAQRKALGGTMVDVLATLHDVDWRDRGLADIGRPEGFLDRQLDRLPLLIAGPGGALPAPFAQLRDELRAAKPAAAGASLIHGDFRLGNLMLARDAPARITGVLDWELAGIGDPLADLAYLLVTYAVPREPLHALTQMSTATLGPGFPPRRVLAARYAAATGRDLSRLSWHEGLQLFKLAVLFEYNRRKTDHGGGDPYYADSRLVDGLLAAARRAVRADAHPTTRIPTEA